MNLYRCDSGGVVVRDDKGNERALPEPEFLERDGKLVISLPTADRWWYQDGGKWRARLQYEQSGKTTDIVPPRDVFVIDQKLLRAEFLAAEREYSPTAGNARCFEIRGLSAEALREIGAGFEIAYTAASGSDSRLASNVQKLIERRLSELALEAVEISPRAIEATRHEWKHSKLEGMFLRWHLKSKGLHAMGWSE